MPPRSQLRRSRSHFGTVGALLAAVAVLSGTAMPAVAQPPSDPTGFIGSYQYAGGEEESRALRSLVDALVDAFNPLLRGIARRRLDKSVQVPERIDILPSSDGFQVEVVGAPGFVRNASYEEGTLVLRQSNFEGTRETRFRLIEEGRVLIMRVATRSALLPTDLDYALTFRRAPEDLAGPRPATAGGS